MTAPDPATEAAARAMVAHWSTDLTWDFMREDTRNGYREEAARALAAARPLIEAEVRAEDWGQVADDGRRWAVAGDIPSGPPPLCIDGRGVPQQEARAMTGQAAVRAIGKRVAG